MNFFHAIVLGLIEGFTEFLPISSTGHLIMGAKILGLAQTDFQKTFEIVIQTGAILAVLPLFIQTFFKQRTLWWYSVAAFIPTAIIGLVLHGFIKSIMSSSWVIGVALVLGGIIMIWAERFYRHSSLSKKRVMTLPAAIYIGICQSIAIIPGVSRSGATVVGGLIRNYDRKLLVTFSFLLSVPTIFAAGAFDLLKSPLVFSTNEWLLLLTGFVVSWISATLCVRWFLRFISKHSFESFGWYRIIIGGLFLIMCFFW